MNEEQKTILLTEEQIDLIARKAAEYVRKDEKELILKCLSVFENSTVAGYARSIKALFR